MRFGTYYFFQPKGREDGRRDREPARSLGVSRHVYVAPTDAEAHAETKDAEMWYQEALRRFLIPDDIDTWGAIPTVR